MLAFFLYSDKKKDKKTDKTQTLNPVFGSELVFFIEIIIF
jgi:hypothetical protein